LSPRSVCNPRRIVHTERGTVIVETALAVSLLLAGVGVLELGRAYQTSKALTTAALEGARVAARPSVAVAGEVDATVRERLERNGLISDRSVGVNVTGSEVTVSYPFQFVVLQPVAQLLVSGSMVDSPITITATSVMGNQAGS
jgi:Flp pilus assembly protein TadG